MASIQTDQIDQTRRTTPSVGQSLWTLPLRVLPTWVSAVLALVGLYYGSKLWSAYQLHVKAERYKLDRRRKAGIPDSDRRDFRLAAADVLRARKAQDEERERERAMKRRAGRSTGGWEKFGEANGLRERPSLQPLRETSMTPSIRYPSLGPQAPFVASPSAFAFGEGSLTPNGYGFGDSDDERQEPLLRGKLSRRAQGEGFGDEPILPSSGSHTRLDSPGFKSLFPSRPSSKRSHTASSVSSRVNASDADGPKRIKVKQEPMSDDIDLTLVDEAPKPKPDRTRKRNADDESADEDHEEDAEDDLMSSGSERLVRPPPARKAAPRKKLRRRQRSASVGSSEASDADMGLGSEPEGRSRATSSDEGDDDQLMSSSSRSPSPPPRPARKQQHKRVLSEVGSVSSSLPRASLTKKRRKSNGTVPPAPISEATDDDDAGEPALRRGSWEDQHGIKFRMGANGRGSERLVLVKKQVRKFDMPADSEHPDRDQLISANIEQWVTEQEFADLKARRALAWQSDEEDGADTPKMLEQVDPSSVDGLHAVLFNSSSLGRSTGRKGNLYQVKNPSATPLRPSQSLSQMHDLYTSSGLFTTTSSRPASPASSAGGTPKSANKLRFSSAAARVRGSPFGSSVMSLARQAKEAEEQKRQDDELAKKVEEEKKAKEAAAVKPAPTSAPAPPAAPSPAPTSAAPPVSGSPFSFGGPPKEASSTAAAASAPSQKPSADAANPFSSSSSTAAPAPTPAASNPFASRPAATSQQPAEEPKAAPASGGFSFGAPSKPAESTPAAGSASPKVSFSFGAPGVSKPAEPAAAKPPAFSFAAPSSTPTPATSTPSEGAKAPPSFNFGAPSTTSAPISPAPASSGSLSFGASAAAKPELPKVDAPKAPSFSFGAPSATTQAASPSTTASTSVPSFSFGAPPMSTTPAAAPANATSSNAFGSASTFAAPAASSSPAPSFSFGGSSTSTPSVGNGPASAAGSAPKFSFGASASAPALGASIPPTPGTATPPASFSFGAKPVDGATAPTKPKATFSFGGGAGAGSGGFSFGSK